jgi:hypothetical protein
MFTRRKAVGLMASSVLLVSSARADSSIILRKSVNSLAADSPEMNALRSAIPAMQQSGFWDRLVAIHSRNWHQHHNWLFLPWHRAFLHQFEMEVRRLSYDDFRMPYLDWEADRIPAMLYDPPFAHDGRSHGPSDSMRDFQGTGGWFRQGAPRPFYDFFGRPGFGGDDESYGHNLVHIFVGGDMGNIQAAPRDPLFWFHHSNVDRLWWYWDQQYGCSSANCYPADWQEEFIHGIEDSSGNALQPIRVASLLSNRSMGYDYPPLPILVMAAPPQGMSQRVLIPRAAFTRKLRLLSNPTPSTTISLPRDLLMTLLTASKADVDAPLLVRSNGSAPHEIRIAVVGHKALKEDRIFAMPMGDGMGTSSYVKNIGDMLGSLAQNLSAGAARARLENEPVSLRVEALALGAIGQGAPPELTECTCEITAKTWS